MTIIEWLNGELNLSGSQLHRFIQSAPHRYKRYKIKKKSGNGYREIAQPSRPVKALQRLVLDKYLCDLPVHEVSYAYVQGRNIKDNAEMHRESRHLVKLDFKNFFTSIKPADLISHLSKYSSSEWGEADLALVKNLFFYKGRDRLFSLSIGAPSSPFISNTIMFDFDSLLSEYCEGCGLTYTRYADDLAISGDDFESIKSLPAVVAEMLGSLEYPRLRLNDQKTAVLSRNRMRSVTGLVITPDEQLSIGRKNKRRVKALVHRAVENRLDPEELMSLSGYLSFCNDVEPKFVSSLRKKYGSGVIEGLLRQRLDIS